MCTGWRWRYSVGARPLPVKVAPIQRSVNAHFHLQSRRDSDCQMSELTCCAIFLFVTGRFYPYSSDYFIGTGAILSPHCAWNIFEMGARITWTQKKLLIKSQKKQSRTRPSIYVHGVYCTWDILLQCMTRIATTPYHIFIYRIYGLLLLRSYLQGPDKVPGYTEHHAAV